LAFGHKNLPKFVQVVVDAEHPLDADAATLIARDQAEDEEDREHAQRTMAIAREETRQMNLAANLIEQVEG
jgi:RNA polymerase-binding transcription factor DksA